MNNLTQFQSADSIRISSRDIAEMTYKQHQHVKRDFEAMCAQLKIDASRFGHIYKADLHDLKHACGTSISGKDFSDRLPFGVVTLYKYLRDWGWMCKTTSHSPTSPTRYAIDRGYLKAKTFTGHHTDGKPFEKISSVITEKGQGRIIAKLTESGVITEEVPA